ncbi:hypothetical protein BGZ96_011921 [Linnemannia gamsii]|uniref:Uncharacterized protein n=1 Tax=Linnemannia gamsii TaxID=64522 RepID=A0ABQ7KAW8_9FUNG|nr:hypothetical protein BGZ96_011921 [Linnemannia gamsii]
MQLDFKIHASERLQSQHLSNKSPITLDAKISDHNSIFRVPTGNRNRLFQSLAANLSHQFPKWFRGVTAASIFGAYSKIVSKARELERFQASAEANKRTGWSPTRMSRIAMDLLEHEKATQAGLRGRTGGERAGGVVILQKPGAHQLCERRMDGRSLEKQFREGTVEREEGETKSLKPEITSRAKFEDEEERLRKMAKESVLESESVVKPEFKGDDLSNNDATIYSHTSEVPQASNTNNPSPPPRTHTTLTKAYAESSIITGTGQSVVQEQPCQEPQRAKHPNGGQNLDEERTTGSSGKAKATMMRTTKGLLNVVEVQDKTIQDLVFDVVRLEEAVAKSQKIMDSTDVIAVMKEEIARLREYTNVLKKETVELKENTDGLKNKTVELKEKSDGLKKETAVLKEKNVRLKEKTDDLKKETEGLKMENGGLKNETGGLKKETEGLKKENEGLKKEADGLKKENDGLKKEAYGLKDETAGFKEEISQLKSQCVRRESPWKWMASLLSFKMSCSRWLTSR